MDKANIATTITIIIAIIFLTTLAMRVTCSKPANKANCCSKLSVNCAIDKKP